MPTPKKKLFFGLTLHEMISTLLGVSSLAVALASALVSYQSYRTARDSRDIKKAITDLSELARQTKRQADNAGLQIGVLQGQVAQARLQTQAISDQTVAIAGSAAASAQSAFAQNRAADTAINAQLPRLRLQTLEITGFGGGANDKGLVEISLHYGFKNTGGTVATMKATYFDVAYGGLPPTMPTDINTTPGNDLSVTPALDSGWTTTDPIKFSISDKLAHDIDSGTTPLFVFGFLDYTDISGLYHHWCFAYRVTVKEHHSAYFAPAGGPAYRCK